MKELGSKLIVGVFVSIIAAIVFVKAGKSGESGGKQSAAIIGSAGDTFAKGVSALEGA